jgi:V/A-type H+-transporting ATPase subunit E
MEVMLPSDKEAAIEKRLRAEIAADLGKGLVIKPVTTITSGFEIVPTEGGFKISATGGDIESYIKEFIRPRINEILFEES